jgi:hypothetical protein
LLVKLRDEGVLPSGNETLKENCSNFDKSKLGEQADIEELAVGVLVMAEWTALVK